ncbi:hypothetical protein [Streptomyces minutiscleroticus]|uniref:hypothetical protein n=1 Tax=Streptomyces minutiscleroticus TaxID=68238 RepID=UPI0033168CFF
MTQNGQGEQPSARPAREGIVLPSDGGEPLLPGQLGDAAAPAGDRAWNGAWGPEREPEPPAAQPGYGGWATPSAGAGWSADAQGGRYDGQGGQYGYAQGDQYGEQPRQQGYAQGAADPSYGVDTSVPRQPGGAHDAFGYGTPGAGHSAPMPPARGQDRPGPGPLPPAAPAEEAATQYLPPVAPSAADEAATQYIPPVGPGALPPEMPASDPAGHPGQTPQGGPGPMPGVGDPDAQATQYLPPVPGQPQAAAPYGAGAAASGERQPPAEFDNLFRSDAPDGAAGSTQQMPRYDARAPHGAGAPGAPGAPGGRAARRGAGDGGRGRGGRTGSRVPLIAAAGIGIVVLGLGAGALLSGGGEDDGSDSKTVSATAPAPEESASASADPAKEQAVALDELLADSGASRSSVIEAVADVKKCDNLDQAAADLRDAAQQRNDLVTRLSGLKVDRLPDHEALTAALTGAWKASASADTHYAAWADEVGRKKGCHKGQARATKEAQRGNAASGTASAQKTKAAGLWNAIARTYGLTERDAAQL